MKLLKQSNMPRIIFTSDTKPDFTFSGKEVTALTFNEFMIMSGELVACDVWLGAVVFWFDVLVFASLSCKLISCFRFSVCFGCQLSVTLWMAVWDDSVPSMLPSKTCPSLVQGANLSVSKSASEKHPNPNQFACTSRSLMFCFAKVHAGK